VSRPRLALAALVTGLWLVACAGHTRPPATVTSDGATKQEPRPGGAATPEPGQHLDAGPDVRPLEEDAATGKDITGGEGGEGGPLGDVLFEYDQAALTEQASALLERHADWLKQHAQTRLIVEGHCDERGTVEYNLALGDQRARAVRDKLLSLGIANERMGTVSYGKERPLETGSSEAVFSKNRRAHFVVTRSGP
jgi:peptidoglycan-associated lipoprotein